MRHCRCPSGSCAIARRGLGIQEPRTAASISTRGLARHSDNGERDRWKALACGIEDVELLSSAPLDSLHPGPNPPIRGFVGRSLPRENHLLPTNERKLHVVQLVRNLIPRRLVLCMHSLPLAVCCDLEILPANRVLDLSVAPPTADGGEGEISCAAGSGRTRHRLIGTQNTRPVLKDGDKYKTQDKS